MRRLGESAPSCCSGSGASLEAMGLAARLFPPAGSSRTEIAWKVTTFKLVFFFVVIFQIEVFLARVLCQYIAKWLEAPLDDYPPSYGFHLFGNNSAFSPHVMARTDMDNTSGTYGLWTPPPGARACQASM